ncbi:potassium transporter KefG [Neiella marina]|uniref:Potassium transporter KefG n=1 Tax=Neiella marina TaxID=508461 RepID=A0A8J2XNW8_9GAMM|nr:NAD(P)H-dependent oxidoreductase [Neiella marina]GGA75449.1 potassium transporter KefG [Neiella marina]
MNKSKILLLFAHPSQRRSEVNRPMFDTASKMDFITAVDLYAEYPSLNIDINREQQRLLDHDLIIFQFPFYWYSTPSILKEWQDLVLEYGFAYGHDGTALQGKRMLCALTAGGSEKAYRADGYNHFTIRELLQPLEQTANMIGMDYLPPFALFGSRTAVEEGRLSAHLECWQAVLHALHNNDYRFEDLAALNVLNDGLSHLSITTHG